jgi:uncharacterized protein (TIGR02453 family)
MTFFTKDFIDFFVRLKENNDRDWFNANKSTYNKAVKEPFKAFVAHMIDVLKPEIPDLLITPKDAIFRIYRDTRFSKDKTPYKEHVSAALNPGGRKNFNGDGIFIQANDADIRVYGGMYMPDKEALNAIRYAIAAHPDEFKTLYQDKSFQKHFGEIHGEKNKRLPKDLQEAAEVEPLIYNKGFYYYSKLPASALLKPGLDKKLVELYKVMQPLNHYFRSAVEG